MARNAICRSIWSGTCSHFPTLKLANTKELPGFNFDIYMQVQKARGKGKMTAAADDADREGGRHRYQLMDTMQPVRSSEADEE